MSRFTHTPSPAYSAFVKAIQEYATTDHDDPREDVLTAVADGLEDHLRDQFKQQHDVHETAGTACIGRLIAGREACHHTGLPLNGAASAQPPHQPPHADIVQKGPQFDAITPQSSHPENDGQDAVSNKDVVDATHRAMLRTLWG